MQIGKQKQRSNYAKITEVRNVGMLFRFVFLFLPLRFFVSFFVLCLFIFLLHCARCALAGTRPLNFIHLATNAIAIVFIINFFFIFIRSLVFVFSLR